MAIENEPAKLLLPYLQRADELQKHEPLVAYYCRLYAMERGLRIPQSDRTKTTSALLVSLMKQLEKDKNSLKLGADDQLHIEGFALSVFEKADNQDRAGRADLNTAKTFYAASIFFEILNQFGELHPDLEQKQKYAAWKAADIRKALKEGRKPVPGTPAGDKDHSMPSRTSISEYEVDSIRLGPSRTDTFERTVPGSYSSIKPHDHDNFQHPTNTSPPSTNFTSPPSLSISPPPRHPTDYHPSESFHQPPSINNSCPNFQSYPTAPSHYQEANSSHSNATLNPSHAEYNCIGRNSSVSEASPPSKQKYEYDSSYQPPPDKIAEAHKAARFAVGALAFDDVSVAVDHLKKSLELLTNPAAGL